MTATLALIKQKHCHQSTFWHCTGYIINWSSISAADKDFPITCWHCSLTFDYHAYCCFIVTIAGHRIRGTRMRRDRKRSINCRRASTRNPTYAAKEANILIWYVYIGNASINLPPPLYWFDVMVLEQHIRHCSDDESMKVIVSLLFVRISMNCVCKSLIDKNVANVLPMSHYLGQLCSESLMHIWVIKPSFVNIILRWRRIWFLSWIRFSVDFALCSKLICAPFYLANCMCYVYIFKWNFCPCHVSFNGHRGNNGSANGNISNPTSHSYIPLLQRSLSFIYASISVHEHCFKYHPAVISMQIFFLA